MISARNGGEKTMGGWHFDKKDTVEDCRTVSIAFLRKNDFLSGWRSGTILWKNWYGGRPRHGGEIAGRH
jgi:hypothetical protein